MVTEFVTTDIEEKSQLKLNSYRLLRASNLLARATKSSSAAGWLLLCPSEEVVSDFFKADLTGFPGGMYGGGCGDEFLVSVLVLGTVGNFEAVSFASSVDLTSSTDLSGAFVSLASEVLRTFFWNQFECINSFIILITDLSRRFIAVS